MEKTYRFCHKHKFLSLFTGHHLLAIQFITSLDSNLCTVLTRCNGTEWHIMVLTCIHKTQQHIRPCIVHWNPLLTGHKLLSDFPAPPLLTSELFVRLCWSMVIVVCTDKIVLKVSSFSTVCFKKTPGEEGALLLIPPYSFCQRHFSL